MTDRNQAPDVELTNPEKLGESTIIPVIKEQLAISSRQVTTGIIDVVKTVGTQSVDVPLKTVNSRYDELRIPVNRIVEVMPQTRQEGDNIIIPVVREEQVVVTRLVLVEEIHLVHRTEVTEHVETVELRSESATINRRAPDQDLTATPLAE